MGGDLGPHAVFSACERALQDFPFLEISAFGTAQAAAFIPLSLQNNARFDWQPAHETFSAELKPTEILRYKQSSLWLAVAHLAAEKADACVSGGSTGALMVAGKRLLGMVPGIDRPAICQRWPTRKGQTHMLDLGANLDASPELLLQFAQMGSVLSEIARPKVALLNIGTESNKGGSLLAQVGHGLDCPRPAHQKTLPLGAPLPGGAQDGRRGSGGVIAGQGRVWLRPSES